MYEIYRSVRYKNRENICAKEKKNNRTQDSIYVVRQFAYVYEVTEILLFAGKNTQCDSTIFLSQKHH